jgi:hypothetical protein
MPIKPRGKVERSSNSRLGYARIGEPQFEITAWCPDEFAKMPPEQVHFIVHLPAVLQAPPMVLRFKSPDTLGFFIEELIKYRRTVWPKSEKVTGETQ